MCRLIKLLILLIATSSIAFAAKNAPDEKLYIKADTTDYNYKKGVHVFTGNVTVDQGNNHLTADKLITKQNSEQEMQEIIAYGVSQPAHYWTNLKADEPNVHAYANIIQVFPNQENIILTEHVKITQGENSFEGERVIYNKNNQTITVPQTKNGRATLIYNPDKQS